MMKTLTKPGAVHRISLLAVIEMTFTKLRKKLI
jgi:hypothetical protein